MINYFKNQLGTFTGVFKGIKMFEKFGNIDIQIFYGTKWYSFYRTHYNNDPIYIILKLIQCQVNHQHIRMIGINGIIIDPCILSNNRNIGNSIIDHAYYNLGIFWENKGNLGQALVDFRNFYRLNPNDPDVPIAIQRIENKIDAKKFDEIEMIQLHRS